MDFVLSTYCIHHDLSVIIGHLYTVGSHDISFMYIFMAFKTIDFTIWTWLSKKSILFSLYSYEFPWITSFAECCIAGLHMLFIFFMLYVNYLCKQIDFTTMFTICIMVY